MDVILRIITCSIFLVILVSISPSFLILYPVQCQCELFLCIFISQQGDSRISDFVSQNTIKNFYAVSEVPRRMAVSSCCVRKQGAKNRGNIDLAMNWVNKIGLKFHCILVNEMEEKNGDPIMWQCNVFCRRIFCKSYLPPWMILLLVISFGFSFSFNQRTESQLCPW